ncbi:hypothetical protein NCCNTM_47190 [Mycolicibacterium sp. NCC-Tsukiji]|nr:hypothetical protein NCCNTM_47190 [Mycolicibacterium sp. NCC-Tsukiji]
MRERERDVAFAPANKAVGPFRGGSDHLCSEAKSLGGYGSEYPCLVAELVGKPACDTPARRAMRRMLTAATPTVSTSSTAPSMPARSSWPWWYGFVGSVATRTQSTPNLTIDKFGAVSQNERQQANYPTVRMQARGL